MRTLRVAASLYVLALALWGGGLVVLGAIVAPVVFGVVPAPTSADAMTIVFRRFDAVSIACAVVALLSEAIIGWRCGRPTRVDLLRAAATVVAAGLAIGEGMYVAPQIEALHRAGAIRGVGAGGLALERYHHLAENVSKGELGIVIFVMMMVVIRAGRPPKTESISKRASGR